MDRQRNMQGHCNCSQGVNGASSKKSESVYGCGLSLAIATVPMQKADWDGIYDFEQALCFGTVFPDLNFPFLGSGR